MKSTKVVLLAGGLGTRLSEETTTKPKPMVEIGGKPILWHIMKLYSHYGFNDFIVCLGYKGIYIKEFFYHYFLHQSDVSFDFSKNEVNYLNSKAENWKITLADTGDFSMTGGRIKRIEKYIDTDTFLLTYGDGVSDLNIKNLVEFHESHGKLATLTAVQPSGKFGALNLDQSQITSFKEKPKGDGSWINGGFFVLNKKVIDLIPDDSTIWEQGPLETLASTHQLMAYKHSGFWKPMDTLRDKTELDEMAQKNQAPWMVWNS